jgi:hypothetical protein
LSLGFVGAGGGMSGGGRGLGGFGSRFRVPRAGEIAPCRWIIAANAPAPRITTGYALVNDCLSPRIVANLTTRWRARQQRYSIQQRRPQM